MAFRNPNNFGASGFRVGDELCARRKLPNDFLSIPLRVFARGVAYTDVYVNVEGAVGAAQSENFHE
jgi:hypothetical protein